MPLQNRVLATGEIVADPARGTLMGNRGILHNHRKQLNRPRWRHKAWIICVLEHKGWHRDVMTPGRYTELFFLDEAVALAAGHRPCALCRRAAYLAYRKAAGLVGPAKDLDDRLHDERAVPRVFRQRRHSAMAKTLPDAAVIFDGVPKLIRASSVLPIRPDGYGAAEPRPKGRVTVLTPQTSIRSLKAGYRPLLHPSA